MGTEEEGGWLVSTVSFGAGGVYFELLPKKKKKNNEHGAVGLVADSCLSPDGCVPILTAPTGTQVPAGYEWPCWTEVKASADVVYPRPHAWCSAGGLRPTLLSNLTTVKGQGPGVLYTKSPMTEDQRVGGPQPLPVTSYGTEDGTDWQRHSPEMVGTLRWEGGKGEGTGSAEGKWIEF